MYEHTHLTFFECTGFNEPPKLRGRDRKENARTENAVGLEKVEVKFRLLMLLFPRRR